MSLKPKLDLTKTGRSFGDWIRAYDAYVAEHGQPPDILIMTQKDIDDMYPLPSGLKPPKVYKWRDTPIEVKQ
jgi:hypothetical protein